MRDGPEPVGRSPLSAFATAVVEWGDHPAEAHFILLVPHPNEYAKGIRLRYVGSTTLSAYREWEAQASRFVHGSSHDPAVIAFSEAARAACEALDTLRNTVT